MVVARVVAAGVLALTVGVLAVLRDGPPAPLQVRVESLDGSALRGETFVRLQLDVRTEGAAELGEVRLLLAGVRALGLSPDGLDDGRATVQVDLVPACPRAVTELAAAALEVTVVDDAGRDRTVLVDLPDDGPLERLVRYRCSS